MKKNIKLLLTVLSMSILTAAGSSLFAASFGEEAKVILAQQKAEAVKVAAKVKAESAESRIAAAEQRLQQRKAEERKQQAEIAAAAAEAKKVLEAKKAKRAAKKATAAARKLAQAEEIASEVETLSKVVTIELDDRALVPFIQANAKVIQSIVLVHPTTCSKFEPSLAPATSDETLELLGCVAFDEYLSQNSTVDASAFFQNESRDLKPFVTNRLKAMGELVLVYSASE